MYAFFFFNLFIFGCAWSLLLHGLFSSCGEWEQLSSYSVQASHCDGFSCEARAPEHRLTSRGTQVWLLHSMWGLPGSGIKHVSPTLSVEFFATEPSGKPWAYVFDICEF